ncbi:MAG: MarR family winged helix-turn-helix transcriptional regulator [Pseudomonadota bacterium]
MTDSNSEVAFSLSGSASHLLHRAQQVAAGRSAEALRAAGITLRQFSVLAAISLDEGVSQSQLVDLTGIDRSTLADMAARMETAKLIKRVPSPTDARAKSVSLMAAGRRALAKATPGVALADEALLEVLPKTRRDSFIRALAMLAEAPEPDAESEAPAPKPAEPAKSAPAAKAPAKGAPAKAKAKAAPAEAKKPKKKKDTKKKKKK